ncbi:hypothetical protein [Longimicrobium sp.]|uniref:hypothetical protein n=1 Tax=Longimicrobium sp. TaxID=2029185 RepID=UPI002ED86B95
MSVAEESGHQHVWWNGTDRPYYCRTCGEPKPVTRPSEPPAEAQQDDGPIDFAAEADRVAGLYHRADRDDLEQGIHASLVNLSEVIAAQRAADTEALRRVRELADRWDDEDWTLNGPVVAAEIRAALDGVAE